MKALYYLVVDAKTKSIYNMGCNSKSHNAKLAANIKLDELVKANPTSNYKIITKLGRI